MRNRKNVFFCLYPVLLLPDVLACNVSKDSTLDVSSSVRKFVSVCYCKMSYSAIFSLEDLLYIVYRIVYRIVICTHTAWPWPARSTALLEAMYCQMYLFATLGGLL